eukprot:GEZU01022088.1.p2 GENE.GEZU01022088.1~~GEZU01022088.1.p2  ORF type:complete len:115 (+),score=28.10 GEZU01022088.1:193-537(+)
MIATTRMYSTAELNEREKSWKIGNAPDSNSNNIHNSNNDDKGLNLIIVMIDQIRTAEEEGKLLEAKEKEGGAPALKVGSQPCWITLRKCDVQLLRSKTLSTTSCGRHRMMPANR